ncbi:hypothetical protein FHX84_005645, partial [Clostridium beijerinckii]|nr:hypothetical protein [Clostridium beijerinckii]
KIAGLLKCIYVILFNFQRPIFFPTILIVVINLCHPQATYLVYHLFYIMSIAFFKIFKIIFKIQICDLSLSYLHISATLFILTRSRYAVNIFVKILCDVHTVIPLLQISNEIIRLNTYNKFQIKFTF